MLHRLSAPAKSLVLYIMTSKSFIMRILRGISR
jgi:hypothetical protein